VNLVWLGPPGIHDCPTPESLRAAVEADVGRPVFADPPGPVSLRVAVSAASPSGWRATLHLEGADGQRWGERTLEAQGPSCAELREPLELAMALMVDPDLLTPPAPDAPPSGGPPPPPVVPRLVIENPKPAMKEPEPPRPTRYSLDLGALASTTMLPGLALGAEIGAEVTPPWFVPIRVRLAAFPHREQAVHSSAAVSFSTGYAGLAVCPELDRGRFHVIGVCVGGDVGLLRAQGRGTRPERTVTRLTADGVGAVRAAFVVRSPWLVRATASLLPSLGPDRFLVEAENGSEELVFQRSPLAWALGLAIGWEVER